MLPLVILHILAKLLLKCIALELLIIDWFRRKIWSVDFDASYKHRPYLEWNSKLPKVEEPEVLLAF